MDQLSEERVEPSKEEIFQAFDVLDQNRNWELLEFSLKADGRTIVAIACFKIEQEELEENEENDEDEF